MADRPLLWNRRNRGQRFRDFAVTNATPATKIPAALLEQSAVQGTTSVSSPPTATLQDKAYNSAYPAPESPRRGRGRPRKSPLVQPNKKVTSRIETLDGNLHAPKYVQVGSEYYVLTPAPKRKRGRPRKDQQLELLNLTNVDPVQFTPHLKQPQRELSPLTIEFLASRITAPKKKNRVKQALSLKRNHLRKDREWVNDSQLETRQLDNQIQQLLQHNPQLQAIATTQTTHTQTTRAVHSQQATNANKGSALSQNHPTGQPIQDFLQSQTELLRHQQHAELLAAQMPASKHLLPADSELDTLDQLDTETYELSSSHNTDKLLAQALKLNKSKLQALQIPRQRTAHHKSRHANAEQSNTVVYINKQPHRLQANGEYVPLTPARARKSSKKDEHSQGAKTPIRIQLTQKDEQLPRTKLKPNQVRGSITQLGVYQRSDKEQQHLEQLMDYYKQVYPNIPYHELLEYLGSADVTYRSLAVHVQHYKEYLAAQKQHQEALTWINTQEYSRLLSLKAYYLCLHGSKVTPTLEELIALEQDLHYQECMQGVARLQLVNAHFEQLEITQVELQEFVQLSPNPQVEPYNTRHLPLEIVYQDEHIVVANKPYGMLSVPGFIDDSVETRVREMFGYAQAAHRLDMATSGLIIIAITPEADSAIKAQFREREMEKIYIAMVDNRPPYEHSFIDAPLACDWEVRPRQRVDYDLGRPCLTEYKVLSYDPQTNVSMVQLIPHTGRTHQLRVHLESLGCPIVGDKFYNQNYLKKPYHRMCLHASYLAFNHPITGEYLQLTALRDFAQDLSVPDYCENPIVTRLYLDDQTEPQLGFIDEYNIDRYCDQHNLPNQALATTLTTTPRSVPASQLKRAWHYDLAHYLNLQIEQEELESTTAHKPPLRLREVLDLTPSTESLLRRAYPHAYEVVQKFFDRLPTPRIRYMTTRTPRSKERK